MCVCPLGIVLLIRVANLVVSAARPPTAALIFVLFVALTRDVLLVLLETVQQLFANQAWDGLIIA